MNTAEMQKVRNHRPRLSNVRRFVMAAILLFFLLQYVGLDLLVGSLSGSVFLGTVKFLDVFAFVESTVAARGLATSALIALLPVVVLYLFLGRAFCGWVCPMDFLFSLAARFRRKGGGGRIPPRYGYAVAGAFLAGAILTETPLFTGHISHLTNIFRAFSAASGIGELQGSLSILVYSVSMIGLLLILELISPRLWCKVLCPVGKTYGLFNKVSLLRLRLKGTGCSGCRECEDACYMGVAIVHKTQEREIRDAGCIYCGRCTEVCREKDDVIRMGFRPMS